MTDSICCRLLNCLPFLQTSYRRYNPRPSCTHVHMDRIYGTDLQCSICGRVPSVNFIYTCQVDADPAFSGLRPPVNSTLLSTRDRSKSPPVSQQGKRRKLQKPFIREPSPLSTTSLITQLRVLGFNASVLKAAETGHYNPEQLNTIIRQKQDVRNTIDSIVGDRDLLLSKNGPEASVLTDKLKTLAGAFESDSDYANNKLHKSASTKSKNRSRSQSKAIEPCDFKVCHTCRPLSRDRSFASVELIMNDEIQLPLVEIPQLMPVHSVHHVKNLGKFQEELLLFSQTCLYSRSQATSQHILRCRQTVSPAEEGDVTDDSRCRYSSFTTTSGSAAFSCDTGSGNSRVRSEIRGDFFCE